jgi:pyrimidine-nucleoside phosphorylase
VVALISDMNQPLGWAVGNALEVREAIDALRGGGPADLREHCLRLAAHMLVLGRKAKDLREARQKARMALDGGLALEKFAALVEAQGGDPGYVRDPGRLPQANYILTVPSPRSGYVRQVHAGQVASAVVALGGGRAEKGDAIDHAVGVVVHRKVGDWVEQGEPLFTVHAASREQRDMAVEQVLTAHAFSRTPVEPLPLFYRTLRS